MNKSIITLSLAMMGAIAGYASPVTQKTAEKVAINFVSQQPGASSSLSIKSTEKIGDELYLINFAPAGFAIVSSDDTSSPIYGYSTTGSMSTANMPENMSYMVSEAAQNVKINKESIVRVNKFWKSYENGAIALSRAGDRVEPLIPDKVNWNQGDPYNKYCPGTGSSKAVVGCVAVSMCQAMSAQRYPARPSGFNSYVCPGYGTLEIDYDKEPEYNWTDIINGANKKDDIARLLYHAGVAVNMGYGSDGSGIPSNQVYRITNALKEHFGYGSDVKYEERSYYKGDWEQLLLNELYADRVVVYNAIDSKGGYGHSFNIDGYDGDGMFHVNWGWGSYGNGYFSINSLKDSQMGMNYDTHHIAVVGIGAGNSAYKNINLTDLSVEAGLPAGSYVSAVLVNGQIVDDNEVTVKLTGEYNSAAGEYRESAFTYSKGILYTKRELTVDEGPLYVRLEIVSKTDPNSKLRQGFNIAIETHKSLEGKTSLKYERDTKMFTVHTKYGATLKVYNSQGAEVPVMKDPIQPNFTFSRDNLTKGTNKLEVSLDGDTKVINIEK